MPGPSRRRRGPSPRPASRPCRARGARQATVVVRRAAARRPGDRGGPWPWQAGARGQGEPPSQEAPSVASGLGRCGPQGLQSRRGFLASRRGSTPERHATLRTRARLTVRIGPEPDTPHAAPCTMACGRRARVRGCPTTY
jgi:hypothetical protein